MERRIIENYIKKSKIGSSFAEIEQELENNNINPKGEYWLPYKSYKNIYIWGNMSENFINAITSLIKEFKIQLMECATIIYYIDGQVMTLPIAKKERDYQTEHWLPMLIIKDKELG